ncbi:MAG: AhpC/TSA family protein [Bacteroides sp.]|nr:AhpC/TSA family protein [Bacteroides sp.]
MNFKSLFGLSMCAMIVSACSIDTQPNYFVTVDLPADRNNTMAYLLSWDDGAKIDSALVTGGQAKFSGHTGDPFIGRLVVDGARGPIFIVEQGEVNISPEGKVSGTPLNDKLTSDKARMNELETEFGKLNTADSIQSVQSEKLKNAYDSIPVRAYNENKGNTLGLYWFLQLAYEMDLAHIDAALAADKSLASSQRVKKLREARLALAETNEGKHYKDFTVTYDGKAEKFSDYVKPGRYTLVDFWASWCGPCIRQTKVIKELYNRYKDSGLDVVGVAVWDEPANTLKAIKSHGLDWPCIINAQNVPTDLYGISGIPCIILINPDGIIVSRDKQDQALIDDVDKAMADYAASQEFTVPSENTVSVTPAAAAPKHAATDTATVTTTDNSVIF